MNILIIEESKTIAQLISKSLSAQGFNITLDDSGFTNEVFVKKGLFEIVVLNTNLPKDRTKRIIEKVKALNINIKILGICSLGGWKDKVSFLKDGGDDVVSYPFPIQELVARIWSLQRRPRSYIDEKLYIGEYLLDKDNLLASSSEKDVKLRRKEFQLLEYLIKNKDRTVSRCELHDHVWDYREYLGSNTVDVHIKRIREKLDKSHLIETIHGQGYKVVNRRS
ncbi:response regulator transcription factor [bacterium]|nr:response regulator transcription factor [bacterium]